MTLTATGRPVSSLGWVHAGMLAGALAVSVATAWAIRNDPITFTGAVLLPVAFTAAGLLLRQDPRRRANAPPCFWAAGILAESGLTFAASDSVWVITVSVAGFQAVPIVVLLLRYPGSRLQGRVNRWMPALTGGWAACWAAHLLTSGGAGLGWWPWLPTAVDQVLAWASGVGYAVLAVLLLVLVVRRVLKAGPVYRRELVPVAVAAAAITTSTGLQIGAWLLGVADTTALDKLALWLTLAAPLAFLASAIQHRLASAGIADLVAGITAGNPTADIRDGLRRALYDPRLELRFWSPEQQQYVDEDGHRGDLPSPEARLLVPVTDSHGSPMAVVITDPSLHEHPDLVGAAVAASALALENARLHALVLAQLDAVRESRLRLVEAGLAERRQVERDLHDGAQQRLLALSVTLGRARATADPVTRTVVDEAREQLRTALGELRELARGIHPALLTQAGLGAAVESLADGAAQRVTVRVPDTRWPPAVEATAYFVVAEGLTNAARHAPGAAVTVTAREDVGDLVVDVADQGPGPGPGDPAGSGLAGLRDRVGALGGTIGLDSAPAGGARLTARIPCG